MAQKKVLVTVPFGITARNILRTDVFRLLKTRCQVIICSKLAGNKEFVEEFSASNVAFCDMPSLATDSSRLRARLQDLWLFHYGRQTGSETLRRHRERLKQENRWGYYRTIAATWLLGTLKLWAVLRALTGKRILYQATYVKLLARENPDLVLSMSPLITEEDLAVIYCARKRHIPAIGFPNSWDNIPKESNPWIMPDKLILWNNIMKAQAQHYLGYAASDIFVTGVPQYDEYAFRKQIMSESDYKAQKGIAYGSKIITYTCGHPKFFVDEEEFIRDLINLVEKGTFGNAVLMLRLHPRYNIENYKKAFSHRPLVFFDEANSASAASYADDWSREDSIGQYVNLLYHSAIIINLASTVTLDAAIFDRPIINVAYDLKPAGYWFANARYYESAHYKYITNSGGARIAYNREQLIQYITMYLADPSLDRDGRKRIVEEQCGNLDGKACTRVVEAIFSVLEGKK